MYLFEEKINIIARIKGIFITKLGIHTSYIKNIDYNHTRIILLNSFI